ncbi:MAG: proton-conducting transporter membrane subunit [Alphaproteobacteria bacterium]
MNKFHHLFQVDQLAMVMLIMVGFIGLCVGGFSRRYLKGDTKYRVFYGTLSLLIICVFMMVCADHIMLLWLTWGMSNMLLVKLMIHKSSWRAAYQSGILAGKNFLFGFAMISAAFVLLYVETGQTSLKAILQVSHEPFLLICVAILLFLGAMTQSAIWPFHGWLTSSLNSPTPVSAIMHAGLVNGGGFLLCRFASLYSDLPFLLTVIFLMGLISALLGTLWKLMQSDVKRMLACSTMSQMGFMIMQCGLGLFPAAITHLCWHGFFKAYLFLASGSAAQEKKVDLGYPPPISVILLSLLCGIGASLAFSLTSHKAFFPSDTTLVLLFIPFIAGSQFAMTILREEPFRRLPLSLISTAAIGGVYGFSVGSIEAILKPMGMMYPQPLNIIHMGALTLMVGSWLVILFKPKLDETKSLYLWALKHYVVMLNASQPHPKTITTHRNHYQCL